MLRLLLLCFILCISIKSYAQTTLFALGSTWKYLDNGSNLPSSWTSVGYNDNTWIQGNAELGYGDGDEATVVSYGPSSGSKYITTYFRKTFFINNPSQFSQINGSIRRDDGAVVYVNGVEVFRTNMPTGTVTSATLASGSVNFGGEDAFYNFSFSSGLLLNGNNTIAVEIHQDSPSSSDISFNCSLSGDTPIQTVQLTRPAYFQAATDNSIVVRWQTDIPTDSKIKFGTSSSNLNMVENEFVFTTEHEIKLTNLQAGTNYFYEIATNSSTLLAVDLSRYFKTNPPIGSREKKQFWVIGDSGMGDANQRAVRDGYLQKINGSHVDGLIMLGDNAYGSGINDGTQAEYQIALFENMYESIIGNTVLWPSLGNHEYNNHIPFSSSPAYFDIFTLPVNGESGGVASGSEKYYSYTIGNVHFIVLDCYDEDVSPSGAMYQWLESDLQLNTSEWTVAYWHHPPYTKGSHDSDNGDFLNSELVDLRASILPLIENYGVDLVLNGHSHSYERSFLIDGHYGYSQDLTPAMILDNGSGGNENDCPYHKETLVNKAHKGTVYAVVGCSSKLGSTASGWPHPVMYEATNTTLGSMLLTVDHNVLLAEFIKTDGSVHDQFRIVKNAGSNQDQIICKNESVTLFPSFPPPIEWSPLGISQDSIVVSPVFSTQYFATNNQLCVTDTFHIMVDQNCDLGVSDQNLDETEMWLSSTPELLTCHYQTIENEEIELTIYSSLGAVIYQSKKRVFPGENTFELTKSAMSQGSYFVNLKASKRNSIKQFIIQ